MNSHILAFSLKSITKLKEGFKKRYIFPVTESVVLSIPGVVICPVLLCKLLIFVKNLSLYKVLNFAFLEPTSILLMTLRIHIRQYK